MGRERGITRAADPGNPGFARIGMNALSQCAGGGSILPVMGMAAVRSCGIVVFPDIAAIDAQREGGDPASAGRPGVTRFHLHLVSDSTGDTVHSVARACLVQFDEAEAIEHVWSMVRTHRQLERVIAGVEANPGIVFYTLVNDALRQSLQEGCRRLGVTTIPILDPVLASMASYL